MTDKHIVDILELAGVDIVMSLPCNMLSGILSEIGKRSIRHVPVCREEEGVGIAAGAALAGKNPLLLMQNSGLGNSINALMSLTCLYKLPLFILMSHRGGPGEKISAQIPMGQAAPLLLDTINIDSTTISSRNELDLLSSTIKDAFKNNAVKAAFLSRSIWDETM